MKEICLTENEGIEEKKSIKRNHRTNNIHESCIVWSIKTSWTMDNWNGFNGLNILSDGKPFPLRFSKWASWLMNFTDFNGFYSSIISSLCCQIEYTSEKIEDDHLWQIQSLHWFYEVPSASCRWLVKHFGTVILMCINRC